MYSDNLRAWRNGASDNDVSAGRDWYPFARKCAREMATKYGVALDTAAGVIAALSPRCDWIDNLSGAETILRAHANGDERPDALPGIYGDNIRKAWRIAQHGENFPRCNGTRIAKRGHATVACQAGRDACAAAGYLHGPKVCEFAETIGGKRNGRVMDVWATRAADVHPADALTLSPEDPRRDGIPGNRLAQLQEAYSAVADEFGEDARVTQAIVWTRIRRVWHRADGRRNGIRKAEVIPF